jgi:hypothetical protein
VDVCADGRVHVTHRKVGEGIGHSKKRSERSRDESDECSNQWNTADGLALGDELPGCSKTVERRHGRSMKEEERNETN